MKQSAQSIEQMRKNYVNLVKQSGMQSGSIRGLQRELKDSNSKMTRLQAQLHDQTYKLIERIQETKSQISLNQSQNRLQSENLLQRVSKAKGELDSRSETLLQLCKDIELYKNEKKTINSQISNLYQQLNSRVVISEFHKLRIYIDNSTSANSVKIQKINKELEQKIHFESIFKKRQIEDIIKNYNILEGKLQGCNSSLSFQIQKNQLENKQKHQYFDEQIQRIFTQQQKKNKEIKNSLQFCYTQLEILQTSFQEKMQRLTSQSDIQKNTISEFQSNINSINNLLKDIEEVNTQRGQQLAKLRVDSDSKGDIGQQVKKLAQKILGHDEILRDQREKLLDLTNCVNHNYGQMGKMIRQLQKTTSSDIQLLSKTSKSNFQKVNERISHNQSNVQEKIEQKTRAMVSNFNSLMKQKIEGLKQKLIFLESLSQDVAKFKKQFQEQLQMNSQLNKQIKQKMERMFGMITKIKADFFVKIQNLGIQQNKSSTKIKQYSKNTSQLTSLLTLYNQLINIIIAVNLSREFSSDDNESKQTQKQYKLSSILQGWILQLSPDKIRYRGQYTSRKALLQVCLQSHVRNGDKIKGGGILQNGKEVFNRIFGSNQQYQQMRKRSLSRKKQRQSELPKVYR